MRKSSIGNNSPYSAAFTGGGFLLEETLNLLPLLLSKERKSLLDDEKINNRILHMNAEKSRIRTMAEIERRFDSLPSSFWGDFKSMSSYDQNISNLYVLAKTYRIIFDFLFNVVIKKWHSTDRKLKKQDLLTELNEISAKDPFVDSWSEATKGKVASAFITILRKAGLVDKDDNLQQIQPTNPEYYKNIGETWFLEACLWAPYQIEKVK